MSKTMKRTLIDILRVYGPIQREERGFFSRIKGYERYLGGPLVFRRRPLDFLGKDELHKVIFNNEAFF